MDAFLAYLDALVTFVPNERELAPRVLKLYYIVDQAPGDQLNRDESFSAWLKKLVEAWGRFLDTPESAAGIGSFVTRPNYHIDDYFVGPSGWLTWPLDGSPYQAAFADGIFTHSFLYVDDYHRYHVPVAGEIKEVRNIHGRVYMDVIRRPDGTLDAVDGETYQVDQERGLIVIDAPEVGLVAAHRRGPLAAAKAWGSRRPPRAP